MFNVIVEKVAHVYLHVQVLPSLGFLELVGNEGRDRVVVPLHIKA